MADLLLDSQLTLYGLIVRAITNFNKLGPDKKSKAAVESRLEQLEKNWDKYELNHDSLMSAVAERHKSHEYVSGNLYEAGLEEYLQAKSEFRNLLEEMTPKVDDSETQSVSSASSDRHRHSRPLPRISLPRFSGKYQEWVSFRDLFLSMVGENEDLTQVEKLHYLKSNVTDDAAKLIASIPVTEANYDRAWSKLVARFENKRALINAQLDIPFALKPLTRKSGFELERLRSTVNEVVESLEALGGPVDSWDYFLVYLVCLRLDSDSHEAWEIHLGNKTDPPTYKELNRFLESRIRALESVDARLPGSFKARQSSATVQSRPPLTSRSHLTTQNSNCPCCGSDHYLATCPNYLAKTTSQRKDFVREKNLCYNCLGTHPRNKCRSTRRCMDCRKDHHSTLHQNRESSTPPPPQSPLSNQVSNAPQVSRASTSNAGENRDNSVAQPRPPVANHAATPQSPYSLPQPLLATALICAFSTQGRGTSVRALLDQGSEMSFVCESLVQTLQLPRRQASISLLGIGAQKHVTTRGQVSLHFRGQHSASEFTVQANVLSKVTGVVPATRIDAQGWSHLSGFDLADPTFHTPSHVDVLLGADIYGLLLKEGVRKGASNAPVAQSTYLGWILSGPTSSTSPKQPRGLLCSVDHELHDLVQQFWLQEDVSSPKGDRMSEEETQCENHFVDTHSRDSTGRYVVQLPFKTRLCTFGNSRSTAQRVLANMHRKFERDHSFKQLYVSFMDEYLNLNHMELTSGEVDERDVFFFFFSAAPRSQARIKYHNKASCRFQRVGEDQLRAITKQSSPSRS